MIYNIEISGKQYQKAMEYQETLTVDVKNIDKNKKTIFIPIYEVIDAPFLNKMEKFPQEFQTYVKKSNQPQFLPSDVKIFLRRMAMEQGLY